MKYFFLLVTFIHIYLSLCTSSPFCWGTLKGPETSKTFFSIGLRNNLYLLLNVTPFCRRGRPRESSSTDYISKYPSYLSPVHDILRHMTSVIYVILWHTMTNVMRHRMSQTIAIWVSNEPSRLVQLIYGLQNHF